MPTNTEIYNRVMTFKKEVDRELGLILHDLEKNISFERVPTSIMPPGVDVATLIEQADNVVSIRDNEKAAAISQIRGLKSVLNDYLSPTVINGGRGFIKPIDVFPQYEEDLLFATQDRLIEWPSGFYRNRVTKETQLLAKFNECIVCYDSLPGVDGGVRIVILDNDNLRYATADTSDISTLSVPQLKFVIDRLDSFFSFIMNQYNFM